MVSQSASSVSEQVTQLLQALGVALDTDTAQNLLTGIADGTENFQSPSTTAAAFEMAGTLLKLGATRRAQAPIDDMLRDPFFNPQPVTTQPRPQMQQRPPLPQRQFPRQFPQPARTKQPNFGAQPPMPQSMNTMPSFDQDLSSQMPQSNGQNPAQRPQQPQQSQQPRKSPPNDWLTPKIYKGSTQV